MDKQSSIPGSWHAAGANGCDAQTFATTAMPTRSPCIGSIKGGAGSSLGFHQINLAAAAIFVGFNTIVSADRSQQKNFRRWGPKLKLTRRGRSVPMDLEYKSQEITLVELCAMGQQKHQDQILLPGAGPSGNAEAGLTI